MKISAINNNNYKTSHKAVNQKLYLKAKNEFIKYAPYHNQLPLITNIRNRQILKLLSIQDAIDTLEAIKPYAENVIDAIDDTINDLRTLLLTQ